MKKLFLLSFILALTGLQAFAQDLPFFASTPGLTRWYYLRNVAFSDLYCTNADGKAYGIDVDGIMGGGPKADDSNPEMVKRQMWSFTTEDGKWYTITNAFDGSQLSVQLVTGPGESCVLLETSNTRWDISLQKDSTIFLASEADVPGGNPIFHYPSMANESYYHVVWLVREQYRWGSNCQFALEEAGTTGGPDIVTDEKVPYYNIESAKTGSTGKLIVDNTSVVDTKYKFTVEQKDVTDFAAQWCLVSNIPGRISIVNRATRNSISTSVNPDGSYNLPNADPASTTPRSWTLRGITEGQYSIYAPGDDKVMRYLNNTALGSEPEELVTNAMENTGFAWKFNKQEEVDGIDNAKTESASVSVVDGKIVVDGGKAYTVTTTDGIRLPKNATLQKGIYIVTVGGKSTKINVR